MRREHRRTDRCAGGATRAARYLLGAWGLLLVVTGAGPAVGQGLGDDLYITGFVSQGYLNSSENNYLVPRSVNGTAEYTEAAITLVTEPADRLRVGMQLLARNFGDTGNGAVVVDWAYGDYRYRDWLGLRAGKVKLPFGLYNEGRDVDMLRTSVFLPQSIYNEKMRDFILAYEGIGAYGSFTLGGLGEAEYHVYGGTLNVPDPERGFWHEGYTQAGHDLEDEIGAIVGDATGYPAEASFRELDGETVTFPWIYGGALIWNTPLPGLRFGGSGLTGRFNFQGRLRYDVLVDTGPGAPLPEYLPYTLEVDETNEIEHIFVLSAEYLRNRWSLASEYYHEDIGEGEAWGWYAQGGWQATDRVALALTYGDMKAEDTREGAAALPDYYDRQQDWTISLRIDLNDHWLFKLERHFIDGVALAQPRSLDEDLADPLQKSWGLFAAKTTFYF